MALAQREHENFTIRIRPARRLLCSPSLLDSAMQKSQHFCATLASLLVLYATNREPEVLVVGAQVRIVVAVVQGYVVREVAIVLCRTPEVRVVAIAVEAAIVEPVAGRQGGKPEGVGAVSTTIPTRLRLENLARSGLTAHRREKGLKFRFCRQEPPLGANSPDRKGR